MRRGSQYAVAFLAKWPLTDLRYLHLSLGARPYLQYVVQIVVVGYISKSPVAYIPLLLSLICTGPSCGSKGTEELQLSPAAPCLARVRCLIRLKHANQPLLFHVCQMQ